MLPAYDFRTYVADGVDCLTPSNGDVCSIDTGEFGRPENRGGWRLEEFVVNQLIGCRRGYIADAGNDVTLGQLFSARSAPIYAAISVNIDAPDTVSADEFPVRSAE